MILEVAILDIRSGLTTEFKTAFIRTIHRPNQDTNYFLTIDCNCQGNLALLAVDYRSE